MFTPYTYPNQTVIRRASYINGKETYMWVRGFFFFFFVRVGEKKQANARVLEDVTSFLSKIALDLPIVLNSGV
jgi:hypothetical protein